jgi:hypothetical protein
MLAKSHTAATRAFAAADPARSTNISIPVRRPTPAAVLLARSLVKIGEFHFGTARFPIDGVSTSGDFDANLICLQTQRRRSQQHNQIASFGSFGLSDGFAVQLFKITPLWRPKSLRKGHVAEDTRTVTKPGCGCIQAPSNHRWHLLRLAERTGQTVRKRLHY